MKRKTHGGTCRNRHRMRCGTGKNGCGARFTLRRHLDLYARAVKCPYCKSLHVRDCEKERRDEQSRRNLCRCDAYPFPHNSGSLRMCSENPDKNEPSEEEIQDYYGCLETPRSNFT